MTLIKLFHYRAITVSSLRKTSTTPEGKEQEQDVTELKEQINLLNEEVKQLKEKNEELTVI